MLKLASLAIVLVLAKDIPYAERSSDLRTPAPVVRTIYVATLDEPTCRCLATLIEIDGSVIEASCGAPGNPSALAQFVITSTINNGLCLDQDDECVLIPDSKCTATAKATVVAHPSCPNGGVTGPGLGTSTKPCVTFQPGVTTIAITWELAAACNTSGDDTDTPGGPKLEYRDQACANGVPAGSVILNYKPKLVCADCSRAE